MSPFLGLATLALVIVIATGLRSNAWLAHHLPLVVVGSFAAVFVAFNWWELWSMRDGR